MSRCDCALELLGSSTEPRPQDVEGEPLFADRDRAPRTAYPQYEAFNQMRYEPCRYDSRKWERLETRTRLGSLRESVRFSDEEVHNLLLNVEGYEHLPGEIEVHFGRLHQDVQAALEWVCTKPVRNHHWTRLRDESKELESSFYRVQKLLRNLQRSIDPSPSAVINYGHALRQIPRQAGEVRDSLVERRDSLADLMEAMERAVNNENEDQETSVSNMTSLFRCPCHMATVFKFW